MALLGVVLEQDGAFVGVLGQRTVVLGAALGWRMAVSGGECWDGGGQSWWGVLGQRMVVSGGGCWDRGQCSCGEVLGQRMAVGGGGGDAGTEDGSRGVAGTEDGGLGGWGRHWDGGWRSLEGVL